MISAIVGMLSMNVSSGARYLRFHFQDEPLDSSDSDSGAGLHGLGGDGVPKLSVHEHLARRVQRGVRDGDGHPASPQLPVTTLLALARTTSDSRKTVMMANGSVRPMAVTRWTRISGMRAIHQQHGAQNHGDALRPRPECRARQTSPPG